MRQMITSIILILFLSGCEDRTTDQIVDLAEGASNEGQLAAALGSPDHQKFVGSMEEWIYDASDGKVLIVITNKRVGSISVMKD